MNKKTLREVSKFASGLVAGDFLWGLWIYFGGLAPVSFLGVVFTAQNIILWMIFDALLFVLLVYYGWHMADSELTNGERTFHKVAGTIFAIVALLHLSRIIFGWQLSVGSFEVPYWLNGLGTVAAGLLAYISFYFGKK